MMATDRSRNAACAPLLDRAARLRPTLLRIARRRTGCPYRAEDVVQDVFLKLLQTPAKEADGITDAYIRRMVSNLAIDRCRRCTLERTLFASLDDPDITPPCQTATAETRLVSNDGLRRVARELRGLPDRDRRIFLLHRLDGIPQKDIADSHRLSRASVCGIIRKAHDRCAQAAGVSGTGREGAA
ncbi:sigma-70 family RNA polymerase sigma factor [Novispirillum itersonii]|uniref:RNA polymerase sigma-70 factor (ECF subfamily) n=1 Tax=Novispirillum itersonii TaxID=189 RepID=A0A7W9ZJ08_NOVIT|nr:sigma-70 family RNA polymerase sigma factor [Novispirillum itersonii]MBB6212391.1 RNA polymerase sigma-70 factor (ECF subfamily) [Novispirillum itersonii]